jgi:DNA-binding NarL/FixJ family response regulator
LTRLKYPHTFAENFTKNDMIQIVVLCSQELVRFGIPFKLNGFTGMSVTGDAGNNNDFLNLLPDTQFNFVLLFVHDYSCVDVVSHVRKNFPAAKILAVAEEGTAEVIKKIKKSVHGYVAREKLGFQKLQDAIRKVAAGEPCIETLDESKVSETLIGYKVDNNMKLKRVEREYVKNKFFSKLHWLMENNIPFKKYTPKMACNQ